MDIYYGKRLCVNEEGSSFVAAAFNLFKKFLSSCLIALVLPRLPSNDSHGKEYSAPL